MDRRLVILLVVIAVVILLLPLWLEIGSRSCGSDSDCIRVDEDCCGCGHGSTATSINRGYGWYHEFKLSLDGACTCITVVSDDPSCFSEPQCVNNVCELGEVKIDNFHSCSTMGHPLEFEPMRCTGPDGRVFYER